MFKKLLKLLELKLLILEQQLKHEAEKNKRFSVEEQWHLKTGMAFNDLIGRYPISEEELLSISETVVKFVSITRITNIDKYLFVDDKFECPRIIKQINI